MQEIQLFNVAKKMEYAVGIPPGAEVEHYLFLVDDRPENVDDTLRQLERFATDSQLSFTKHDANLVAQGMTGMALFYEPESPGMLDLSLKSRFKSRFPSDKL
ncbi:MAG: hypothetical protein PHF67_03470 [Candidatus Nanoarchaeia archaeon]|nr:hypothetical protein [Candidatus Nanoarchaeia archaeon]